MPMERLLPMAEGRLMTGRRALEGGLVDRHGGLLEAIAAAREQGGLDEDAEVRAWPGRRSFLDDLAEMTTADGAALATGPLSAITGVRSPLAELLLLGEAREGATVLPFGIVFR